MPGIGPKAASIIREEVSRLLPSSGLPCCIDLENAGEILPALEAHGDVVTLGSEVRPVMVRLPAGVAGANGPIVVELGLFRLPAVLVWGQFPAERTSSTGLVIHPEGMLLLQEGAKATEAV